MIALKTFIIFLIATFAGLNLCAQTIVNGNFNSANTGWGCNPEAIYFEPTYGGTNSTNRVAEVDQQAGLCQTVSGFTIGTMYTISFKCSRRTTCGPTFQSMRLNVNNGALDVIISRNGGAFNFTMESFSFIATSTTQIIKFSGLTAGTCNLILDNITLTTIIPLPIELIDFSAIIKNDKTVALSWQTASERNNDYFTIERTIDGENWTAIQVIQGAGYSTEILSYSTEDFLSDKGIYYYRLKQTDFDGAFTYSDVRAVTVNQENEALTVFPNPTKGIFTILKSSNETAPKIYTNIGTEVAFSMFTVNATKDSYIYNISNLSNGFYFLKTENEIIKVIKN